MGKEWTNAGRLGVNVDHVATVRNARGTRYPDPVTAASMAELAGADQITVHLREDRRHIRDRDVRILRETVKTRLNLEMAATDEMLEIALQVRPDMVTLVPERREEMTTEGGLDAVSQSDFLTEYLERLRPFGGEISLFIDADEAMVEASADLGADIIELHTGDYCRHRHEFRHVEDWQVHVDRELTRIFHAAARGHELGMTVAAGHGLDYQNVLALAGIEHIEEFNIGHSIVGRAVFVGFERAVREMIEAIALGRSLAQG